MAPESAWRARVMVHASTVLAVVAAIVIILATVGNVAVLGNVRIVEDH